MTDVYNDTVLKDHVRCRCQILIKYYVNVHFHLRQKIKSFQTHCKFSNRRCKKKTRVSDTKIAARRQLLTICLIYCHSRRSIKRQFDVAVIVMLRNAGIFRPSRQTADGDLGMLSSSGLKSRGDGERAVRIERGNLY